MGVAWVVVVNLAVRSMSNEELGSGALQLRVTFRVFLPVHRTLRTCTLAGSLFSGSNGDPSHPQSLHYSDPSGKLNQYQQAIWSIGHILQDYDSDKMFPVYGFGGRVSGNPVSHCFPLCR